MKPQQNYLTVLLLSIFHLGAFAQSANQTSKSTAFEELYELIQDADFFSAQSLYAQKAEHLSVEELYWVEIMLDNAFNKTQTSHDKFTELRALNEHPLPDSLLYQLYQLEEDNALKRYLYRDAAEALKTVQRNYAHFLSEEELAETNNSLTLWSALEQVPAQLVIKRGTTRIKLQKDKVGLKNLKVSVGDKDELFIFDTGANLSTTTVSTAKKLGMRMIPVDIQVGSITGAKVPAQLAVCEQMQLGSIELHHVVFLVMADEDLAFPQIDYQINGILGFPVIEALGEIQITRTNNFIVPETETAPIAGLNMAMNGLTPLVEIDDKHFSFDTGAHTSMLYSRYYEENKADIEAQYPLTDISFGGAGGAQQFKGYRVDYSFRYSDKRITLKNIDLLRENLKGETVYGNLGQDLIRQFESMTINFNRMVICLE